MGLTIGLDATRIDSSPAFGVNNFGSQADKEYLYIKVNGAIGGQGEVAVIDTDGNAHPITTTVDLIGRRVGVAPAAAAIGTYCWLLIRGEGEFMVAANCAAHKSLRATTVGGVVDDAGSGPVIEGMVSTVAAGAMQTLVKGRLTYPTLQEQAAGGGGGGVSDFLSLDDTPSAFGTAGQVPAVNTAETALEFVDQSGGGGGGLTTVTADDVDSETATDGQILTADGAGAAEWEDAPSGGGGGGGASTFLALTDTPSAFGTAGQVAKVNTAADAIIFEDESGGGGGGGTAAYQRVDSLVFTAVGSTTTQMVQQTLAATGFLVEDYEDGGESPVTAVASGTTFMMKAGVYLMQWDATITNTAQRSAPTIDVQDDSDDSVIGSTEFYYLRYAQSAVRFTFQGLLVVAADDTVCKAIVYNKTEDEAFTVAAGHKLRIVSLAGGGGTGMQQSGAFSISDVEVITGTTATTEYGLGTTWLNVVDALSPTFDPIDPDDILWVSIGLRVDAAAGPRILIMGSDIRQMNHTNDPLPSDLVNADEVPGAYYSARVARNNEDRVVEINPTLGWMEDRRMAGRYGVLFAFGENPAGDIASIRPFVSAAVEIDIEYITITVKGS